MKRRICCLLLTAALAGGCARDAAVPAATTESGLEALSVTRWTARTELFAEYPPLIVAETSRFAIHLTRLEDFKALTSGHVDVLLRGGSGAPEVFSVDSPSRPGIFGVDVRPTRAGSRELVIRVRSAEVTDEHVVGSVPVHPDISAARNVPAGTEEAPGISFLKEQQWTLDFGTALVSEQSVRASVRVPGRVVARPGGDVEITAPVEGRLTRVADLTVGARVSRGLELARLMPAPAIPGDLPALQRARAEAEAALSLATRDRERAQRLTDAGAAPARRLDEARTAEALARTRLAASQAIFAQYESARGGRSGDGLFLVRAPIEGVIAERTAAAGANVSTGSGLFRVVDPAAVHVVGRVPEVDAPRLKSVSAVEIEAPGRDERLAGGRLVEMGRVLDEDSRTVPITFTFDNRRAQLPVGQAIVLHLLMGTNARTPVIPMGAVVDDAGRPIVFVQREGETFERRAVTLGARAGALVQVTDGVAPGERVVTRGAYLVRLASLSTSVPAHGHVH